MVWDKSGIPKDPVDSATLKTNRHGTRRVWKVICMMKTHHVHPCTSVYENMVYPQIAILIGTSMRKHWSFSGTLISDKAISFTVTGTPMFNSVMCSLDNLLVRMNPPCGPKVRKGMILRYDERYCQVKEWYAHKQGRGAAAYHVTYDELDTGKQRVQKFGSGVKLVKVEPDKQECQAWTIPVDPIGAKKNINRTHLSGLKILKVMGNSSESS